MIVQVKFIPIADRDIEALVYPELGVSPWSDENGDTADQPDVKYLCSFMNWDDRGLVFHTDEEMGQIYTNINPHCVWLNGPLELSIDIGDETDPERIQDIIWEKAQPALGEEAEAILEYRRIHRPDIDAELPHPENEMSVKELNAKLGLVVKCPYPDSTSSITPAAATHETAHEKETDAKNYSSEPDLKDIDFLKEL